MLTIGEIILLVVVVGLIAGLIQLTHWTKKLRGQGIEESRDEPSQPG